MRKSSIGKSTLGKGFYIALAVSVVAVGSVAYLMVSRMNNSLKPQDNPQTKLENKDWSIPEMEEVGKNQSGIIKEEISSATEEEEVSEDKTPIQNTGTGDGAYIMPLVGEIMTPYSKGELVKSKTLNEWRTHDGIDIKASEGTPVKSIYDGIVKDVTNDNKWGMMVEVEYPKGTVFYCGLADTVKVKKGQEVKLGDVLGEVGNTSVVETAEDFHLHLSMKKDNKWIDPMTVMTKN